MSNGPFPRAPVWVRRTDGIINVPDAYRYENRRLDTAFGLILFIDNHHFGYCETSGEIIIPARFDAAESFKEGLAAVQLNGKFGYIDRFGNWLVPPTLDHAHGFWFGVGLAQSNGLYGLIDHAGNWIKPPTFSDASILSGGIQVQTPDGEEGFIDSHGNFLKTGPCAEHYHPPTQKK